MILWIILGILLLFVLGSLTYWLNAAGCVTGLIVLILTLVFYAALVVGLVFGIIYLYQHINWS